MMGPNFMDEIDCGSFFDQIDDLIEFPVENDSPVIGGGLNPGDFPSIWSTAPSDPLRGSDPILCGNNSSSPASDLSAELSVPYEDMVQLEWLSNFVEDSFSGRGMTLSKENKELSHNSQFQTSSPVSVLESSSSCSGGGGKVMPLSPNQRGPQRARSKRPRPATFNPRPAIQLISPTSSITDNSQPFLAPLLVSSESSENHADSPPMKKTCKPSGEQKKKKKIKPSLPPGTTVEANPNQNQNQNQNSSTNVVRKCMHCEITKTPQWRAGPMGPKTLCNACGVRFKSGRLFPEYRPAASPTFVPALHSNSHKKVIEMRTKTVEKTPVMMIPAKMTTELEIIPNCKLEMEQGEELMG